LPNFLDIVLLPTYIDAGKMSEFVFCLFEKGIEKLQLSAKEPFL
jgi:hypothetical protein